MTLLLPSWIQDTKQADLPNPRSWQPIPHAIHEGCVRVRARASQMGQATDLLPFSQFAVRRKNENGPQTDRP